MRYSTIWPTLVVATENAMKNTNLKISQINHSILIKYTGTGVTSINSLILFDISLQYGQNATG